MSLLAATARAQLRTTANLIKYEGQEIVLKRPAEPEDDGAGGVLQAVEGGPYTELDPQRVYVGGKINNRQNNLPFEATAAVGERRNISLVIVGMPEERYGLLPLDIQENDRFDYGGNEYYVTFVMLENVTYQIKAEARAVLT